MNPTIHDIEQYKKELYAERGVKISAKMAELKERGEATGAPPVGYRIVRQPYGIKHVEEDPVMMPLVREAKELYVTGKYSVRELLKVMTEKGLRSRTGKVMGVSSFWNVIK